MKKIWVHKTNSFKSAEGFDEEYYFNMNSTQRLEIMQFLRKIYFKFNKNRKNEGRKGLRRAIKVIQQV